jgi:hypothetical protein
MTRALLAVLLLVSTGGACKGKSAPSGEAKTSDVAGSGSAAPVAVDWKACDAALAKAAAAPLHARPMILIEGCRVCGDPTPIVRWNTPHTDGGPSRADIEAAMLRCTAYCNADAKQRFLGTLDQARGTSSRAPWRQLGEVCKAKVSALPDQRFSSGPLLLLDRIARATSAHGGETATLAAAFDLPLPAVTLVGTGVQLPDLETVSPTVGAVQITALAGELHVGRMPRAKLGVNGVTVELGPDGYPGKVVALADLGSVLKGLVGDDKSQTITLLAPHATPAQTLVPVIAAAAAVAPVYLAANAHEAPEGWDLPGAIPVALEASGASPIVVTGEMSVQQLATELGKRVARNVERVGVTAVPASGAPAIVPP